MGIFATFVQVAVDAHDGHMGGRGHMGGWGSGWMWLWGALVVVACVAIAAFVVWLIARDRGATGTGQSRARQILDERYARGEISTEEYRERVDQLR